MTGCSTDILIAIPALDFFGAGSKGSLYDQRSGRFTAGGYLAGHQTVCQDAALAKIGADRCESGRIDMPGKHVSRNGTVGSNPTLSAIEAEPS